MIESALMVKLREVLSHNKVWCVKTPPNPAPPYVVIELENAEHERYLNYQNGVKEYFFEVSCYGKNIAEAVNPSKQIISALESFRGQLLSAESPQVSYAVLDIEINSQSQVHDYAADLVRHSVFIVVRFR